MKLKKMVKQFKRSITHSKFFVGMIGFIARSFIRLYFSCLRIRIIFPKQFEEEQPFVMGFWHGTQFLLMALRKKQRTAVLTDISWAGDIQASILSGFGQTAIRGSSKHGPTRALLQLYKAIKNTNTPTAIALDGPRGPNEVPKPGIFFLAKKLSCPIIPVMTVSNRYWEIPNTWCKYQLPKPFSRCIVILGEPLENCTDEGLSLALADLRSKAQVLLS